MRTIVLSDLHLGASPRTDLLQRRAIRERLMPRVASADRILLLGDVIEMRDRPLADVLADARPFFEDLREAAPDAELVLVPGNHDHQLLEPWLRRRRLTRQRPPIGLEERIAATGDAVGKIAGWAGRARTALAYPGIHLRSDVYAIHGHYLDCHVTTPTFERLGVGALQRFNRGSADGPRSPDEYERILAPLYALLFALAQGPRGGTGTSSSADTPSMRLWQAASGASGTARTLRRRVLGSTLLPGAIKLASSLGLGKLSTDLSLAEIGRAGARAMGEVVERLEIDAEHIVFGHTHRRGPLPMEVGRPDVWRASGRRLHNCGSWVYSPALIGGEGNASAFWPGTVIEIESSGEPRSRELLSGMTESEIREALRERG